MLRFGCRSLLAARSCLRPRRLRAGSRPQRPPRQAGRGLGQEDAREDDARREGRPARRAGPERRLHARRQRGLREAGAARARGPRRRLPRLRRRRGAAAGAAQSRSTARRADARSRATRSRSRRSSTGCSAPRRCRCCSRPTSRAAPATSWRARRGCRARWRSARRATRRSPSAPGRVGASEGRALGVHVDFYPVVDVNVNPQNPVINIRSFGEDPELVARMATAYMRGIQQGGMLATAKHFPGHGDTATDTHLDLAVIEHPRARLDAVELVPFRAAIAAGIDAVMSSHIRLPALDPTEGLPATLSRPDPHRPAARGAGLRGTRLHGLDVDARDQQALHAGRRRRRWRSRREPTSCSTRPIPRRRCAGSGRRSSAARSARPQLDRSVERILRGQGAARAPARRTRGRRGGARERRRPRARGGRGRDRVARDHAAEGRARPGAAGAAAEGARARCCRWSTPRAAGARRRRDAC